ncbi:DUF4190 domain-containing protein [Tsukamurella sp. NPDC003166]|uniref:DUF4190 domain-containing protein n=1 Tax=Tsukamurella sp. NPDC003166 TaxID=3154444 RepID=UPI0033B96B0D
MSDTAAQVGRPLWLKILLVVVGGLVVGAVGDVFGGALLGLASLLILVIGIPVVIVRHTPGDRVAVPKGPAHIGFTDDGQPIYPVVGYTADGAAVTADRAQGVTALAGQTNSLAIAALVLAFVFSPAGIIMGHIARGQIRRSGEAGDGMALAALIIGYVSLAISIAVIIAAIAAVGSAGGF